MFCRRGKGTPPASASASSRPHTQSYQETSLRILGMYSGSRHLPPMPVPLLFLQKRSSTRYNSTGGANRPPPKADLIIVVGDVNSTLGPVE